MNSSIAQQYNDLHNKHVSRDTLEHLLAAAKKENEDIIAGKLALVLLHHQEEQFFITISKKVTSEAIEQPKPIASEENKEEAKELMISGLSMPVVVIPDNTPEVVEKRTIIDDGVINDHPKAKEIPRSARLEKSTTITPKKPVKALPKGLPTMADLDHYEKPTETYTLHTELGRFFGELEKKPKHSVVVTLDAPPGSGKTRMFFQAMQDFASTGKNCLFFTLEEHSASKLFKGKRDQYISTDNYGRITIIDEVGGYEEFKKMVLLHDVIFVDSFGKLRRLIKEFKITLDEDIRKAFDGKLFFLIFQRTSGKTMRGGSDSEFDGDVILQVEKPTDDYRDNYLIARKNRYNDKPNIKYSIYNQTIIDDEEQAAPVSKKTNIPKSNLIVRSL